MRIGAMNHPSRPLLDEIAWIAANGFDYIDLTIEAPAAALESTDWPQVRLAIEEAGLGVVCHAAPYFPVENPSPAVRQAALDELRRCIDVAQQLGATLCTTHFRGWPAYLSEEAGYEYYRQLLSILIRHGEERGVQVALENSTDNRHQLKYFREIFHRLPQLKLLFDIGHGNINTAKSMTRDYLFALGDRLAHVHLSDNNGKGDDHLPIGAPREGGIHLRHELRGLRSFGYDDGITLEVFGDRRWLLASAGLLREEWEQAY
ncbi:MAG TPA: sugar phosphate isomerase/epimerase family protein [Caldilineaceae bacterium]|nr:sugar phosphate isomerase/epimerase family protein [Caldilineaceae bacterium]